MSLVGCARFGDDEKKSGAEGEERTGLGEEKPRGSKGSLLFTITVAVNSLERKNLYDPSSKCCI